MTDATPLQAQPGQLMSIGQVAAQNIAQALNLDDVHVSTIEGAIKDEIKAMSTHFTMAFADVQTSYEIELAKIKSDFNWVTANKAKVAGVVAAVLAVGYGLGALVHFI